MNVFLKKEESTIKPGDRIVFKLEPTGPPSLIYQREEELVYNIHGSDKTSASLLRSREDFLRFMVMFSEIFVFGFEKIEDTRDRVIVELK